MARDARPIVAPLLLAHDPRVRDGAPEVREKEGTKMRFIPVAIGVLLVVVLFPSLVRLRWTV